jgi:hypothetical protein
MQGQMSETKMMTHNVKRWQAGVMNQATPETWRPETEKRDGRVIQCMKTKLLERSGC